MILAHNWPTVLDPSISQIEPVLRTNFYLFVHVQTIVASYGAGALAWGLSMFALGIYAFRKPTPEARELARLMGTIYLYRVVQVAVILLAAGTILGGVWAADSWGRFWGWDPKETWALISLLCYVLVLHGRFTGWWNTFGMAAGSNLCFLSILMSWYGVNFVLPLFNEGQAVGLHGYGLGKGGLGYALTVAVINLLYLGYATIRYYTVWRRTSPVEADAVLEEQGVLA
jgi:ABC-type transport system involved in cytochrome c biogenesis permease subunit